MTIPIDKKAQEKDISVLSLKSTSATDPAQRLCCDRNSQAKQNLGPEKHCKN